MGEQVHFIPPTVGDFMWESKYSVGDFMWDSK
jgi:hypothetical protein